MALNIWGGWSLFRHHLNFGIIIIDSTNVIIHLICYTRGRGTIPNVISIWYTSIWHYKHMREGLQWISAMETTLLSWMSRISFRRSSVKAQHPAFHPQVSQLLSSYVTRVSPVSSFCCCVIVLMGKYYVPKPQSSNGDNPGAFLIPVIQWCVSSCLDNVFRWFTIWFRNMKISM